MDKLRFFLSFLLLLSFILSIPAIASPPSAVTNVDLLIVGGTIVTMNAKREIIENGAIAIKGGILS